MSPLTETSLRRTPLFESHRAAGAKLMPFAGWEMPVQYEGIRAEHLAVRRHAGMFDVSHMGQVQVQGSQALEFLQRMLSNDLARMAEGDAQYSVMCQADGGVMDDVFAYRLSEQRFLIVTNAANHRSDVEWLQAHAEGFDAEVNDCTERFAMLAVQGPAAPELVRSLSDATPPPRMHCRQGMVAGVPALVCGTGYTGEDGVELLMAPQDAPRVWDALLSAGVTPTGLGARDTLRLEVCFHLYGNDLSLERGPIEAGLGWCCKEDTGFVGSDAVARTRHAGAAERLVAFVLEGTGIPRAGNAVLGGGTVTSGTFSPSLERGIGMAYVSAQRADPGTSIEIDVRGRTRTARIEQKPLYRKGA